MELNFTFIQGSKAEDIFQDIPVEMEVNYSKRENDDDGNDVDMERSEVGKLPPLAAKIARQAKFLQQRMGGVEEDIHEEDDKDEEKGTGWGRYKNTYFGADNADFELLSSDDELQAEEHEALRMQREKAKMLSMGDFGLEDSDKDDDHDHDGKGKLLEAIFSVDKSSANGHSDEVLETSENFVEIKKDLDALSKEEQMNVVYSSAPELVGILLELKEALEQCKVSNSFLSKVKESKNCKGAVQYWKVKQQIYLAYCQAIGFYLLLKSEGQAVRDHPVIGRLVEIRGLVEKVKKNDRNLPSEMETLLSSENIGTHQQKSAVKEDSAQEPKLSIEDTSTQSCENEMDSLVMVATDKDHGLKNARIQSGQVGLQSKEMLKLRATLEEKMKHKGIYNSTRPRTFGSHRAVAHSVNKSLEAMTDFDDEVAEPAVGLSKQQPSVHSAKLSQIVGTKGYRSMFVSGDDDLPRRDDIGERRRKHELRVLARTGAGSMDDQVDALADDNGNGPMAKKMGNGLEDGGIDAESEDEFYKEAKRQRVSKLSARAGKYSRALDEPSSLLPEAEEMTDGKRLITQQIEKNRGLTRHRKKDSKNPRKKYKMKHKKAMIRRKGQVRDIRKPSGPYGGEATGINIGVSRSIRFKN